jgi:molecular chaperone Hsp33
MDYLVRGVTQDGEFRFAASITTQLANEARRRHETRSGATKILGETMTAATLLATQLKGDEKISLQITGNGPVRGVLADVDAAGNVRGFIDNPQVYAELEDAPGGPPPLGEKGLVSVIRSTPLKLITQGTVPLFAGDVASDVGAYLTSSEQALSAMALHSGIAPDRTLEASSGILLQALPGANLSKFAAYKGVLENPHLRDRVFLGGKARPEEMVETLMNAVEHESPYEILAKVDLRFQCTCSREKVADMIRMIGAEEIHRMREEDGQAEVTCRFCNERYVLDHAELGVLLGTLEDLEN